MVNHNVWRSVLFVPNFSVDSATTGCAGIVQQAVNSFPQTSGNVGKRKVSFIFLSDIIFLIIDNKNFFTLDYS